VSRGNFINRNRLGWGVQRSCDRPIRERISPRAPLGRNDTHRRLLGASDMLIAKRKHVFTTRASIGTAENGFLRAHCLVEMTRMEIHPSFAVTQPRPPNPDPELLQATKAKLLEHMAAANRFHRQDMADARARMKEANDLLGMSNVGKEPGPDIEPEM